MLIAFGKYDDLQNNQSYLGNYARQVTDKTAELFLTQIADILERFSAQWLNGTADTSTLSSVIEAASAAPPQPSSLSKMAETFGELEMVLTGLNLPDMIPVFRQHQVTHWMVYLYEKNCLQCMA